MSFFDFNIFWVIYWIGFVSSHCLTLQVDRRILSCSSFSQPWFILTLKSWCAFSLPLNSFPLDYIPPLAQVLLFPSDKCPIWHFILVTLFSMLLMNHFYFTETCWYFLWVKTKTQSIRIWWELTGHVICYGPSVQTSLLTLLPITLFGYTYFCFTFVLFFHSYASFFLSWIRLARTSLLLTVLRSCGFTFMDVPTLVSYADNHLALCEFQPRSTRNVHLCHYSPLPGIPLCLIWHRSFCFLLLCMFF